MGIKVRDFSSVVKSVRRTFELPEGEGSRVPTDRWQEHVGDHGIGYYRPPTVRQSVTASALV